MDTDTNTPQAFDVSIQQQLSTDGANALEGNPSVEFVAQSEPTNVLSTTADQDNYKESILFRMKFLKSVREDVEMLKSSAEVAMEESEKVFARIMEKRCAEVKNLIETKKQEMLNDAEELAQALEQDIYELRKRENEGKPHSHKEPIHFLMRCPSGTQAFNKMQTHVLRLQKQWDDFFSDKFKSCSYSVEEDLGPYTLLSLCSKTVDEEDLEDLLDLETVRTQELNALMEDILDRLERDNFDESMKLVDTLPINTDERLKGIIKLIYDEAVSDREDTKVCINMCYRMRDLKVPSSDNPGLTVDFHQLLLNHCQTEFKRDRLVEIHEKRKELLIKKGADRRWLKLELEEARTEARDESVNNIKFICELFRKKMLTEDMIHSYIVKLLRRGNPISLECTCTLMTTIGKDLDVERAKPKMDKYYLHFESIIKENKSTPDVCDMLEELLELRREAQEKQRERGSWRSGGAFHNPDI